MNLDDIILVIKIRKWSASSGGLHLSYDFLTPFPLRSLVDGVSNDNIHFSLLSGLQDGSPLLCSLSELENLWPRLLLGKRKHSNFLVYRSQLALQTLPSFEGLLPHRHQASSQGTISSIIMIFLLTIWQVSKASVNQIWINQLLPQISFHLPWMCLVKNSLMLSVYWFSLALLYKLYGVLFTSDYPLLLPLLLIVMSPSVPPML